MKSLLVLALVGVALVYATNPTTITIQAKIRDFTPAHPDFEHYCCGDSRHAVGATLDQDHKPFLQTVDPNFFTSAARFAQWYRDTPGNDGNIPLGPIDLTLDEIAPGLYSYNNQNYFPIDNQGFGNYYAGHNFHFTSEIHTKFTYQGGEVFTFIGDDDVFVFINLRKAIDLGGVHGAETLSVNLDASAAALGLTVGQDYDLHVFHAERHTTQSTFRMDTTIQLVNVPVNVPPTTVYICGVAFPGFGANVDPSLLPKAPKFYTFGNGDSDSFSNYNVISFGDFHANTGDTQGRVATRNNFVVGNGYSVGYEIHSGDASAPDLVCQYSLIVGRDATFGSGSVYPLGNNIPYNAPAEHAFVGGNFNAPQYLQDVRTGSCSASGCLDADFDNAQAWYALLSSELAAQPDNAHATVDSQSHAVSFTCTDPSAATYYVTFTSSVFSSILSYNVPDSSCNPAASWVINVALDQSGSGDVNVGGSGQHFQAGAEYVLYNFPGYSLGHVTRNINTLSGGVEGSILAPFANLNNDHGMDHGIIIVGNVVASDQFNRLTCPPPATPPTPPDDGHLCPYFETNCDGLNFPLKDTVASFRDFNVISFGDWNANTGDIEGRLAVRNNLNVGAGYSVGYQIQTGSGADNFVPYSVVVGANANWISGAVYPEGNNIPYPGAEEDLFVGGTFTGEQDLANRVLGSCNGNAGCLNANFDAAQQCYVNYQNSLASNNDNAAVSISWSAIIFTCADNSADIYYITLDASVLTEGTYYILDNCNFQAKWVVNVAGTGSVVFAGDNMPGVGSSIVYNILGSGRSIDVQTEVNGNILAPQNTLNQNGGVIEGKVVVGNGAASLQVNKPVCSSPAPVVINAQSNAVVPKGSSHVAVNSNGGIQQGDSVSFGNQLFTVVSSSDSDIELNAPTSNQNGAGSKISATVSNPSASRVPVVDAASSMPAPTGSASALQACVALIVAVALLF